METKHGIEIIQYKEIWKAIKDNYDYETKKQKRGIRNYACSKRSISKMVEAKTEIHTRKDRKKLQKLIY